MLRSEPRPRPRRRSTAGDRCRNRCEIGRLRQAAPGSGCTCPSSAPTRRNPTTPRMRATYNAGSERISAFQSTSLARPTVRHQAASEVSTMSLNPPCQPSPGTGQRAGRPCCRIWLYGVKGAGRAGAAARPAGGTSGAVLSRASHRVGGRTISNPLEPQQLVQSATVAGSVAGPQTGHSAGPKQAGRGPARNRRPQISPHGVGGCCDSPS
jgi:hypothetical protein